VEKFDCSHRIPCRLLKIYLASELRFGEPKQAHRFEPNLFALARRLQRGIGSSERSLQIAAAHLHQREAVARLRLGSSRLGAIRKVEHLGRVRAGARQVALCDEAFCA
jgi:hypothetical protein